MSGNIWNKKKTYQLIKLWESHPELWNSSLKDYRDRQKKAQAIEEIARPLDVDKNEVTRKLHNLRCQMNTEIRKMKRIKRIYGEDKSSTWEFFGALKLMWGLIENTAGNNAKLEKIEINEPPSSSPHPGERLQSALTAPIKTRKDEKKVIMKHKLATSGGDNNNSTSKRGAKALFLAPTDEWTLFGDFVAAELRQIRSEERRKRLKRTIQELIISVGEEEDYERFQSFHSTAEDSGNVIVTYYRNSDEHTSILP